MNSKETVFIDGTTGEGGGQILRTSLALSCITERNFHIYNIRASRRNPGLAKQHLSCIQAACQICNGKSEGATRGSKVLDFQPGPMKSGNFYFNISSAGSTILVIQALLPALFLADKPSTVTVTGGTHNPLAPPSDFFCESFLPAIATGGFQGNCQLMKYGFFPAGGGKIIFNGQPWKKQPGRIINLCQPIRQFQINARIYTAKLPAHIAQRQRRLLLQSKLNIRNIQYIDVADSDGPGNCVMIRICSSSQVIIFTSFGMRGKPSQKVISEVVNLAQDFLVSGAAIDRFLADQLLIYMAISKAGSYTTNGLSSHLLTNMEIIKKFLPVDFRAVRQQGVYRISCNPA